MTVDLRGRTKPRVIRTYPGTWLVVVTRGYSGNYEHEYTYWDTWRDAHQHAYETVKRWRP